MMLVNLGPDLSTVLIDSARKQGISPEELALRVLREHFLVSGLQIQATDEWGRGLLAAASDCGVSLSNEAVSSDGLYD
jgi:hypothetical protein